MEFLLLLVLLLAVISPLSTEQIRKLVERVKTGDQRAFEVLQKEFSRNTEGLLRRVTGSVDVAEDLNQEVWLVVWKNVHKMTSGNFRSWALGVSNKIALRWLTRNYPGFTCVSLDGYDDEGEYYDADRQKAMIDLRSDPANKVESQQLQKAILDAINSLPEVFRVTFVLVVLENRSYDEVARQLNVPIGTVRSRVNRAREKLQEPGHSPAIAMLVEMLDDTIHSREAGKK